MGLISIEEHGALPGGGADTATARIDDTYPGSVDTFARNSICNMRIKMLQGVGNLITYSYDAQQQQRIELYVREHPYDIPAGTLYRFEAENASRLVMDLTCSPPWDPDQAETIPIDDKKTT